MRPDDSDCRRSPLSSLRTRVLVAACVLLLGVPAAAAETDADRLERLRAEIAEIRQRLENDGARLGTAREKRFELERTIREATEQQVTFERRIAHKTARIDELRALKTDTERQLEHARDRALDNAAARYALGFQPKLKVLLHQEDARKLSRHLAYYDYVIGTYRADAERTAARIETLAHTEAALKLETNKLRRLRHDTVQHLESLKSLRAEHAALAASIAKRMGDDETRMTALVADEAELLGLLERLATSPPAPRPAPRPVPEPQAAAAGERPAATAFDTLKGHLEWPAGGRVLKAPGKAMRDGGARWAGVLIETPAGTEVRAVAQGQVVFADWFRNLGQLVIVDHGGGYMSLYGNNAELYRQAGDAVEAGEVIATVGNGEGELPQGLYFELRSGGNPLDPRRWCVARR